jgi:hypothetical protein
LPYVARDVYVKLLQNKPKMQLAMRLQKHLALTPIPRHAVSRRQPKNPSLRTRGRFSSEFSVAQAAAAGRPRTWRGALGEMSIVAAAQVSATAEARPLGAAPSIHRA